MLGKFNNVLIAKQKEFKGVYMKLSELKKNTQANNRVFYNQVSEYKKGLRNLVLTTEKEQSREVIENWLSKEKIPYIIHEICANKINVYFGSQSCINIVAGFDKELNKISPEQDFILGIMLGYDRLQQCDRYLKRKEQK